MNNIDEIRNAEENSRNDLRNGHKTVKQHLDFIRYTIQERKRLEENNKG